MRDLRGAVVSGIPETKYVRVGDSHLAYQVFGNGPPDILLTRSFGNHLELQWEDPHFAAFMRGLATFGRVITFDGLGWGMSDPVSGTLRYEELVQNALAVLDAVGAQEVVIVATVTPMAVTFAASHPERVMALVLLEPVVTMNRDSDWEFGKSDEEWRDPNFVMRGASPQLAEWLARYARLSAPRGKRRLFFRAGPPEGADVRGILPALHVSTLVIQHLDSWQPGRGRAVAERIEGARLVELPGQAVYLWWFPDPERVVEVIQEFVTGEKHTPRTDRVLATVMFTDVVESTSRTAQVGDRRWTQTLDAFEEFARRQVDRFGGKIIKSTGDGHLATFDSPGRAILCACGMRDGVGRFEIELRAGLHTGEIEKRGEDIGGLAVSIARRVCDEGGAGDVLVSGAVPPLVAGSGISFTDRGMHQLKGVPDEWRLFAVEA
jgi:class 3 adenylate cyclase